MQDYEYAQREPMENEAMVRTLDTQARAIWPQERPVLERLLAAPNPDVLDVGCGTGEISIRIAKEFPSARVIGVDLAGNHIRSAESRASDLGNVTFRQGDAHALPFPDDTFDIALCRHMLHGIPDPMGVISEMYRVVKPNGTVYFIAEDYGMLYFHPTALDIDELFSGMAGKAAIAAGADLRNGRKIPAILASHGCADISVQYLCIDTLRVERDLLADMFLHWRDGFTQWISEYSGAPADAVQAHFDEMIACAKRPDGYAAWLLPSISARVTTEAKRVRK